MPELPEVETIKRIIEPQVRGLVIKKAAVRRPEVVAYPSADEFCGLLKGQTIFGVERRGKFLMIRLSGGDRMILHLRMTGCLLLAPVGCPEEKHTHVVFYFDNGTELRFSDTRRFGRWWLLKNGEMDHYSGISRLGMEPLDQELTAEYLSACLGKRKKAIKECLLDQGVVAGIGNIYSDEILFAAGIFPARPAKSLNRREWERLAFAIPERISYFIEKNRTTPEDYWETKGRDYRNTPFLQVYGQAGKACPKCGETLCRIVVGGRSSVYCPACQQADVGPMTVDGTDVFLLWHIHDLEDDFGTHEEEKLIGVFSSEGKAEEAIELLKGKEGFRDLPVTCFEIHKMRVDRTGWTDGFCTVRWRE